VTDRSTPDHPDLETLSEWLDDPDAATDAELAHVDRCELCQGRLGELRWARDSVAQRVPPLPAASRDRAIADALAAMVEWPTPAGAPGATPEGAPAPMAPVAPVAPLAPVRSRGRWWWVASSAAAAVLVVVVATVALLGRGSKVEHNTALSAAPSESGKAALSSGGAASDTSTGDSAVSGGDLGDVPNADVLRSRVAGATNLARGQSTAGTSASLAPAAAPAAPVPNVVGTRVCEAEARTVQPQLGVVVYAANLRFQGTAAVVLGFAPTPGVPPATLLVLAPQEGCRLLVAVTPS